MKDPRVWDERSIVDFIVGVVLAVLVAAAGAKMIAAKRPATVQDLCADARYECEAANGGGQIVRLAQPIVKRAGYPDMSGYTIRQLEAVTVDPKAQDEVVEAANILIRRKRTAAQDAAFGRISARFSAPPESCGAPASQVPPTEAHRAYLSKITSAEAQ